MSMSIKVEYDDLLTHIAVSEHLEKFDGNGARTL